MNFDLLDSETIKVEVPEGYASGSIIVTIHGYELVCGAMMNPAAKGDVTIFYLKNYKYPFKVHDFVGSQILSVVLLTLYPAISKKLVKMYNRSQSVRDNCFCGHRWTCYFNCP